MGTESIWKHITPLGLDLSLGTATRGRIMTEDTRSGEYQAGVKRGIIFTWAVGVLGVLIGLTWSVAFALTALGEHGPGNADACGEDDGE